MKNGKILTTRCRTAWCPPLQRRVGARAHSSIGRGQRERSRIQAKVRGSTQRVGGCNHQQSKGSEYSRVYDWRRLPRTLHRFFQLTQAVDTRRQKWTRLNACRSGKASKEGNIYTCLTYRPPRQMINKDWPNNEHLRIQPIGSSGHLIRRALETAPELS